MADGQVDELMSIVGPLKSQISFSAVGEQTKTELKGE